MTDSRPTAGNIVLLFCLVACWGCNASPYMHTEYVEGIVTVDGSPIEGANVTFVPAESSQGISGIGVTDSDGVFKLTTMGSRDGLKPQHSGGVLAGEYFVGVEKIELSPRILGQIEAGEAVMIRESDKTYVVPIRYSEPEKSGLKVEVTPGSNQIPLNLHAQ